MPSLPRRLLALSLVACAFAPLATVRADVRPIQPGRTGTGFLTREREEIDPSNRTMNHPTVSVVNLAVDQPALHLAAITALPAAATDLPNK